MRVFGALQTETVTPTTASDRPKLSHRNTETPATVAYQIELERLQAQLDIRTAELALAKERIAELKTREHSSAEEKNRLLTLVEQQSRLLSAPPPTPTPQMPIKRAVKKIKAKAVPSPRKSTVVEKTVASAKATAKKVAPKAAVTAAKRPVAVKKLQR